MSTNEDILFAYTAPYTVTGDTAEEVWYASLANIRSMKALNKGIQAGRDQITVEMPLATFYILDPRKRYVLSREIDLAFAFVEFIWHMCGRHDLSFLEPWNKRMKNFSDDGKTLHGAYGYRLRGSNANEMDQLLRAYTSLLRDPTSRQVVLQIWDHDKDMPEEDGKPVSKDIPCSLDAHILVRNGKVHWHQNMRSNDLIWGTPYDFIVWTLFQEVFAGWLNLKVGWYKHSADSLHVYKRHWDYIDEIDWNDYSNLYKATHLDYDLRLPYGESQRVFGRLEDVVWDLGGMRSAAHIEPYVSHAVKDIPLSYKNIVYVLAAERLHRIEDNSCLDMIENCTYDVMRYVWYKYYNRKV